MIGSIVLYFFSLTYSLTGATLTFEGVSDNTAVDGFYSRLGMFFTGATAFVDVDAGGAGDFGGEPSPVTAVFTELGMTMDIAAGIAGTLSFYYSNPRGSTNVRTYKQTGGVGDFFDDSYFPPTPLDGTPDPTGSFSPFAFASIQFDGVRRSVQIVSRGPGGLYIDNLTVAPVPEPSTLFLAFVVALIPANRICRKGIVRLVAGP